MPLNLSKIGKVLKTLNRFEGIKEFNASLPVKIEVKKEINPIKFLINLGNREIETKSYIPLKVGKKYFAQIKEGKYSIKISNLKEYPKILEILKKIDFTKEILTPDKKEIMTHLTNANSKTEFIFWMNVLMAFNQNIYHLIINEKKKALMQLKYKKNSIKFYAVFEHLGEIEGILFHKNLKLFCEFASTINLINFYKNELPFIVEVNKKEITEIYQFSENLINLKV
ncbi:conserved hypothetical protein [Lebetimonas natsushimae]|uniref:Uncharacterized protein n=1 Tax=Lebetimonas natsushimae TaxID=1936991 RepID=A0A292YD71_9BACT|nr:hypothetical protein [Lebetimonas natsushimae]GAX87369.1 conserved hypothetical protein [Lebetimonas natsushimae]